MGKGKAQSEGRASKHINKDASRQKIGQQKQKQRFQDNVPLPDESESEREVSDQARPALQGAACISLPS